MCARFRVRLTRWMDTLFCNVIFKIFRTNRRRPFFGFRPMSGDIGVGWWNFWRNLNLAPKLKIRFWPQKSLNENYQFVEVWKKATTSWKLLPAQFSAAESRNRTSNTVITVSLCPTISPHMGRDPKQRWLRFVLNIFKILLQKSISFQRVRRTRKRVHKLRLF